MKAIYFTLFFVFLLGLQNSLIAQNENRANIWYFGDKNGIDFNTNPPSLLFDGELTSGEGSATLCDPLGNLLIYTNGEKIWNRNHQVMEGAENLMGNLSATQSSLIIPQPDAPDILYVFYLNETNTNLAFDESGQLYYAIIDMTLNNGLGGIVSVNNFLYTGCAEKLTAIRHCNNKDFWILAHENGTNNFVEWKLTATGLSIAPEVIAVGSVHQIEPGHATGYMKGSPLGDKLALNIFLDNTVELFSFDKETGAITSPILFQGPIFNHTYGLAFSPNGKRLYVTNFIDRLLLQINLDLPTAEEIRRSTVVIANTNREHGAIQNAPDGRLYLAAKFPAKLLSVIHEPNELGTASNFREESIGIGMDFSGIGLPNFPAIYFRERDTIETIEMSIDCEGIRQLTAITNVAGDSVVYQWYVDNNLIVNEQTTTLQIEDSGFYEFKALVFTNCNTVLKEYGDTLTVQFDDLLPLSITEIEMVVASCNETNGSLTVLGEGGQGQLTYSIGEDIFQEVNYFDSLAVGNYTISLMDERGCVFSEEVNIDQFSIPRFMEISTRSTLCGEASGGFSVDVGGGFGELNVVFDGNPLGADLEVNDLESGDYELILTDATGCSVDSTITITQFNCPFYIPNIFSPNGDGLNDLFEINTHPDFDGVFQHLEIYDRWGNLIFKTQSLDNTEYKWNGEFQGKPVPIGVYMYVLTFNYLGRAKEVIGGTINLLR